MYAYLIDWLKKKLQRQYSGHWVLIQLPFDKQNFMLHFACLYSIARRRNECLDLSHTRIRPWLVTESEKYDCFRIAFVLPKGQYLNTLMPRQNGRHFADDIFKWIFLNENVWVLNEISLKYVPYGLINNMSVLVQILALRRTSDKPLSEPMVVNLLTHICVTRSQWLVGWIGFV